MDTQLLNDDQVAQIFNIKPQTLAVWRCNKRYDLPYIKIGRSVRYRLKDIEEFIEKREFLSNNNNTRNHLTRAERTAQAPLKTSAIMLPSAPQPPPHGNQIKRINNGSKHGSK